MIKLVTVTAHKIEKLSAKLVDCANAVSTASNASEHNTAVEQFTVVKHNWQSNVSNVFNLGLRSCVIFIMRRFNFLPLTLMIS